jgi:mannose-1-phosphate guanylyltransferase
MPRVGTTRRGGMSAQFSAAARPDASRYAAVILAGGEGVRLSSFTRKVFGYHLPKQFCPLFEGETLLERTLRRTSIVVPPAQTITVLTRAHEGFYCPILGGSTTSTLLIQPENRGTATAIMGALLRLIEGGHTGPVAIFPSDHYVSDDLTFMRHVSAAFCAVELAPQLKVLLGITPDGPETEYGWIESGAPVAPMHPDLGQINQVRHFREKPSPEIALNLYRRKCLWNSFILIANAMTLLSLIANALPGMYSKFRPTESFADAASEEESLRKIFRDLPSTDFSVSVLSRFPEEFSVLPVKGVSWSDLGDARRLLAAISSEGSSISGGNQSVTQNKSFAIPGLREQINRYKSSQGWQ